MKFLQTGDTLATAAAKAGMDQKTARKWRRGGQTPSQAKEPRGYRTRTDVFAEVWSEIEQLMPRWKPGRSLIICAGSIRRSSSRDNCGRFSGGSKSGGRSEGKRGKSSFRKCTFQAVIHSLVKKPGAFAHYRFQASLYPRVIFRVAYDELKQRLDGRAEREYLQLLKLAAEESEERVAEALRELVGRGEQIGLERVREVVGERRNESLPRIPRIEINAMPLQRYDLLLGGEEASR